MHDFMKIARSHHQVLKRAGADVDDPKDAKTDTTSSDSKTTASSTTKPSTTTSPTSTSTTATHTSTSALINISLNGSTSSSASSSSTSATHTTSSSSSAAPKAVTTSSPPPTTTHAEIVQASSTVVVQPSVAASATASATPSSSGGLSSAATGGIIAGCVLVGVALLIFAVRKTFIRRRQRKRNTWGAGIYPEINVTEKYGDNAPVLDPPPVPEKSTPRTPIWAPPRPVSPNPSTYYVTPPPMSYNNPVADGYSSPTLAPATADIMGTAPATGGWGAARPSSAASELATVRVVYIPSLPDELSVTTGEIVHIVKAYDDGWALCRNVRGEEGVVPLECLDRSMGTSQGTRLSVGYGQQEGINDWKNMKRISSLSTQQPRY